MQKRAVLSSLRLSVKNYMSPLEGVQELEEKDNSFRGAAAPAPPTAAFQWPFEPGFLA